MRLCRFRQQGQVLIGFFEDDYVVPVAAAARQYAKANGERLAIEDAQDVMPLLPLGADHESALLLAHWVQQQGTSRATSGEVPELGLELAQIELLVPIPVPKKFFLLAGNYAKHIEESGGVAAERAETFPYVFMKPASTTFTDPGKPVVIPRISPAAIDWELELAVLIGSTCRNVTEEKALESVAGYTIVNDISNREFRPNPGRRARTRDAFFDWLHGKWHDSFCPCGPCVTAATAIGDPQELAMQLRVAGDLKQDSSTAQQIFPVAAIIAFISSFVTLEPGDLIATGTPAGVGKASGTFLRPGDQIEATIERIGALNSPVVAE